MVMSQAAIRVGSGGFLQLCLTDGRRLSPAPLLSSARLSTELRLRAQVAHTPPIVT